MAQVTKEGLERMIEKAVQKEIMNILPPLVASAVKQVMVEMVQGSTVSSEKMIQESTGIGNTGKMTRLVESSGHQNQYADYPDMNTRQALRDRIASGMGLNYGDFGGNAGTAGHDPYAGEITVDSMPSDPFGSGTGGTMIPVHPSQIPQSIRKILNKDYSEIMDRVILKK